MRPIRQGDVWLYPIEIDEVDLNSFNEVREIRSTDVLLALGEVTGHAHRIKQPGRTTATRPVRQYAATTARPGIAHIPLSTRRVLVVKKTAKLTHEEHETLTIPKGIYEVRIQREYDPATRKQTYVVD